MKKYVEVIVDRKERFRFRIKVPGKEAGLSFEKWPSALVCRIFDCCEYETPIKEDYNLVSSTPVDE